MLKIFFIFFLHLKSEKTKQQDDGLEKEKVIEKEKIVEKELNEKNPKIYLYQRIL